MKPYVYIARPIPEQVEAYIAEHCDYKIWRQEDEKVPTDILYKELQQVDGAFLTGYQVNDELLSHAERLKVVSISSVGYDNYDTEALKRHGVIATHTPYVLDETVADLLFALILSGSRRIAELHEYVKAGKWGTEPDSALFSQDVHHATLGIIGMGRIGEKIVRRARLGFEMEILYHNRSSRPRLEEQYEAKKVELDELLQQADVVVVMVPLTEETRHFIGKRELDLMKPTALLVNGARGSVIDEPALVEALQQKKIHGAALDVFEQEPLPQDHPLLSLENVTLTPHIGSATAKTREGMAMRAAENLVAGVTGGKPRDVIKELREK
ncbi:2-hydroxyacid dehydrogenase [Shouchella shacheensis]|uniref:2-hydroxyacid dehydrogenase n=1 Tax=Shouchella shacheensis TaxID=1649580 RepID=UPI00074044A9|nr:D-glycerate dehydrogenase [Shouchella shacheensis]